MIATESKPVEEILATVAEDDNLIVIGCGGCAKTARTGGEPEVAAMVEILQSNGKTVIDNGVPDRTCNIQLVRDFFKTRVEILKQCGAILVLGCGGAVQIVRQATEEYDLIKPVYSGLNAIGHMDTVVPGALFVEQCRECGDCILNRTGAICPITKCPKSLLNGPCGGSKNGKCEVDPERDCAWILIYQRLKALGKVHYLREYWEPKDYSKAAYPRKLSLQR